MTTVTTTYTYDILNHLTGVSMPRGSNTQTRTFNYTNGSTVGIDLLSATNPENGTVTYIYNSDHTLNTKTDAKGQHFTYGYDSYKRVTGISVGGVGLRTFIYDTNTLDGGFSGPNTKGRLVAVQNAQFNAPGTGAVTALQFTEMYGYTVAGLVNGKRLQVNETLTGGTVKTLNLDAAYTYDIEGKIASLNYPTTYAWNGSTLVGTSGPTYTYSFDAMDRATGLKDQNNNTAVSGVQYNAANQYLGINYYGASETRTYNSMNQMTRLTIPGSLDITYTFSSTANDGKITGQTDNISGETVTYQYDSLKRLIAASGSGWSEGYGYDAFGNLVSKTPTGGAPTLSQAVSATTNQIVGQSYDANGNQTSGPLGSVTYDAENRILTAPGVQYAYDSKNKRIWRGTISGGSMTAQEVYFYGVDGQKLGTYALTANAGATPYLADSLTTAAVFFANKRVGITTGGTTTPFVQDRLGSNGKYYPYGEDRGTPLPNDQVKFATYTRDSASGLDYADQRYYANNFGRFMNPDPSNGSMDLQTPQSFNRYAYVLNDPMNGNDATGLDCQVVGFGLTGPTQMCDGQFSSWGGYTVAHGNTTTVAMQGEGAVGETNYVVGTVAPAYMQSALNSYPVPTQVVFPDGAVSATITFGDQQAQASALVSALTVLPEMFYAGFVNLLLNDDPKGALQIAGSLALAVGPGEVMDLLAGAETAADGSVLVARWGSELQPGNWVMRGGANRFNYVLSGKWQPGLGNEFAPYSSGATYWVPGNSLGSPAFQEFGVGAIKGGMGQAIYGPLSIHP